MKNKKTLILTSAVILIPMILGLLMFDELPNQIATHFNTKGVADRYNSKLFFIFVFPTFMLGIHLFSVWISKRDKKFLNSSVKLQSLILWIIPFVSVFASTSIYANALGYKHNIPLVAIRFISLVIIIIGNYLPKCKQNYVIGIRLPWTLDDEDNWNKTHRFSSKIWVLVGVLQLGFTLLFINALLEYLKYIFIFDLIVLLVVPTVYSFINRKK